MQLDGGFYPALPNGWRTVRLEIERAVGGAVAVRLHVVVDQHEVDYQPVLKQVADLLSSGKLIARPRADEHELLKGLPVRITGCDSGGRGSFVFVGSATGVDRANPDKDPLMPRYRVLNGTTLTSVLERLDRAAVLSPPVLAFLDGFEFADGEQSCVLQAGVSDWALLHELLDVVYRGQVGADRHRAVLTGSLAAERSGKWVATFSTAAAYSDADRENRRVDTAGFRWESFAASSQPIDLEAPNGGGCHMTRARRGSLDPNAIANWQDWLAQELPLFDDDDRFVTRAIDVLQQDGTSLRWIRRLVNEATAAVEARWRPPTLSTGSTGVFVGTVLATDPAGPWIEVQLPGFESGSDQVKMRVSTPYSGANGTRGLHLVPETGTSVLVVAVAPHSIHGSQLRSLAVAACNLRDSAAALASPSLALDAKLLSSLAAVEVQTVGKVEVGSALAIEVAATTTLKSGATTIDTGAEDIQLKGGNLSESLAKGIISLG